MRKPRRIGAPHGAINLPAETRKWRNKHHEIVGTSPTMTMFLNISPLLPN